ncbi:MAG: TPR end-of-group domain-containing protein [Planctomycetota bacterium]
MKALSEAGEDAISPLIFNFSEISDAGKTVRLRLLQDLIVGPAENSKIRPCLESDHVPLRGEAVRYLAGHPDIHDPQYLDWTRNLLSRGDESDRAAYLDGIPAIPPFAQKEAVLEAFPAFTTPLKIRTLDWIRGGRRAVSSRMLDKLFRKVRSGELEPELFLPVAHALKKAATENAIQSLQYGFTSSSPDVRAEAAGMHQAVEQHLFRSREYLKLIEFRTLLHHAFPSRMDLGLDLADAMIQYSPETGAVLPILLALEQKHCKDRDTASLIAFAEIQMARALTGFWTGREWEPFLDSLAGDGSRTGNSYPMRRVQAKQDLLRGALKILDGADGAPDFRTALARAPYDAETAEVDGIFLGRFSLSNLVWRLSREGREDDGARIFDSLVAVLREDAAGCGYYPDTGASHSTPDRIRSAIPLYEAFFLLYRCGRPEEARMKLELLIQSNQDSALFANTDLLARAHYDMGLALLDLERRMESIDSFKKGIKCYEQLMETMKEVWPGPARDEMMDYYRREKARGMLYLQTATYTGPGDRKKCLEWARKALRIAPDFVEAAITFALVQARSGHHDYALQLLDNIDCYPDRYYNVACLLALANRPEEALGYLERHVNEHVPRMRRTLEKRYASRDPDLASLRRLPEFIRLVGGD